MKARSLLPCCLLLSMAAGGSLVADQMRPRLLGVGPPPNADALFDDSVVHEIRLAVNANDWQTLKDHYLENTYYPADLRWRDQVVRNIGIRSRGTGSRSPVKPGLTLDFDRYTTNQKFLGLKGAVLRNNTQDPSNLHERISMLLFQRMGLPASREAHTRLYVNDDYVGLYTIVESVDEKFLARHFDEDSGYLYDYDYPATAKPYYFEYRGPDPALYVPMPFKPETHESDPQPEVIEQLIWTINETSDAAFRTAIGEYLDVPQFIRHVALEMFIVDDDGILGDWGMNNYYFYRLENQKRFTFIVWDKSEAFKAAYSTSVFRNIEGIPEAQQNRLMRRVLSYADLYDLYLDTLLECTRSASEPAPGSPGGPGWLEREIQREYEQVRDAALADPVKPFTNDQFETAVNDLAIFARHRGDSVTRQVQQERGRRLRTIGRLSK